MSHGFKWKLPKSQQGRRASADSWLTVGSEMKPRPFPGTQSLDSRERAHLLLMFLKEPEPAP